MKASVTSNIDQIIKNWGIRAANTKTMLPAANKQATEIVHEESKRQLRVQIYDTPITGNWTRTGELLRAERMMFSSTGDGYIINDCPYAPARSKNRKHPVDWQGAAVRITRSKVTAIYRNAMRNANRVTTGAKGLK